MTGNDNLLSDGSPEAMTTEENLQEQDVSSSSPRTQPQTEAERAAAVADLLNAVDDDEDGLEPPIDEQLDAPEGEGTPEDEEAQMEGSDEASEGPLTLAEAAERLGIEPSELYSLAITTGDGETVSLGDLKDAYQNRAAAERESAERDAELNSREAQVIADQQVWSVLAASGQLPNHLLETARGAIESHNEREADTLMRLVPELQDNAKLDNFRRDMVRVLGDVGYKAHEIALSDHRQALFVRRYLQMEREVNALKKANRPQPPKSGKPNGRGKPNGSARFVNQARNGTEADKLAAVSRLISGG